MYNVRECMSCLIVNIIIEGSSVCHCSRVRVFVIVQQPQFLQANYQLWDKPSMANLFLDEHGVALMMRHGAPQLITVIILYLCVQCPYPISFPPFPPQDSFCHGSAVESYDVQYLVESVPEKPTSLTSAAAHCTLRNLTSATRYQAKVKVQWNKMKREGVYI